VSNPIFYDAFRVTVSARIDDDRLNVSDSSFSFGLDLVSEIEGYFDGPDVLTLDRPVPVIRTGTPPIPRWRIENRVVSLAE
jgi:hypothetical protein